MLVQRMALLTGNLPLPKLASVSFSPAPFVPNDGGGEFYITYSITNAAGGEYVSVTWTVTGTSSSGSTTSPFTSSPLTIDNLDGMTGLYTGDVINATVNLYSATSALLDTVVLSPYNC
jgi:hypothetical protein